MYFLESTSARVWPPLVFRQGAAKSFAGPADEHKLETGCEDLWIFDARVQTFPGLHEWNDGHLKHLKNPESSITRPKTWWPNPACGLFGLGSLTFLRLGTVEKALQVGGSTEPRVWPRGQRWSAESLQIRPFCWLLWDMMQAPTGPLNAAYQTSQAESEQISLIVVASWCIVYLIWPRIMLQGSARQAVLTARNISGTWINILGPSSPQKSPDAHASGMKACKASRTIGTRDLEFSCSCCLLLHSVFTIWFHLCVQMHMLLYMWTGIWKRIVQRYN